MYTGLSTKNIQNSFKKLLLLAFTFFSFNTLQAGNVTGKVYDQESKEPLVGAVVFIKSLDIVATTNLEGAFKINNLKEGEYVITCRYSGYSDSSVSVIIKKTGNEADDQIVKIDFGLSLKGATEVVLAGQNRETDINARKSEQKSDNVINIMSAQTIQLLPDITVANAMQRVSGISIEKNSVGEGQYAIVRGMDKRYNYTLVNGIKIPSPDNKNRYVPLDLFPSEILERLEVIKALTPSMEGDAIGGAINLVMKNAPDQLMVRAQVGTGINQMLLDRPFSKFDVGAINFKDPSEMHGTDYLATPADFNKGVQNFHNVAAPINGIGGVTIGNRLFNKKFGFIVSGSYQNTYKASSSIFMAPAAQPVPNNVPVFDDLFVRQYSTQTTRYASQAKLDYNFDKKNNISLLGVFVQTTEIQTRHQTDSVLSIQRTGPGSGLVETGERSRLTQQSIYSVALQGNDQLLPQVKLNYSLVNSLAKAIIPDWTEFKTTRGASLDSNGHQVLTPQVLKNLPIRWTHNSDKDLAAYLNLTYDPYIMDRHFEFTLGGMYRHKTRDNYYNEYTLSPVNNPDGTPQHFSTFDNANWEFRPLAAGYGGLINPNTYTATENITAAYAQFKFNIIKNFQALGGARLETTDQSYETVMPESFIGKSGSISYYDLLPSLHLKYALTSKQNLRFSYFKSITRPGFFEITPYLIPGETFDETGNPYLKHTKASNFDLRYEYFPKGSDQLLLGIFYKDITNPIEYSYARLTGPSALFLQPNNFGNATNYGFEMVYTHYMGNFGVNANYTYTNSAITTDKLLYTTNFTNTHVNQTRPLQGQSANVANLSLIYKDTKNGFDAQIAMVYTGRRIDQVSAYLNLDYWQKASTQLDFSAEMKLKNKRFSVYCKVTNLLNTPTIIELEQPNIFRSGRQVLPEQTSNNRITVEKDLYGQGYLVGLRYKL